MFDHQSVYWRLVNPRFRIFRLEEIVEEIVVREVIDMSSAFQGCDSWSARRREQFMGYLLEGGKAPPCYATIGPLDNRYEVPRLIDGTQRITACVLWLRSVLLAELSDGRRVRYYDLDAASKEFFCVNIDLTVIYVPFDEIESQRLYLRLNGCGLLHSDTNTERARRRLRELQDEVSGVATQREPT